MHATFAGLAEQRQRWRQPPPPPRPGSATRNYSIPKEVLRYGRINELVIGVRNLRGDGGIWRSPVELAGNHRSMMKFQDATPVPLPLSAYATLVAPGILRKNVSVLASVSQEKAPALPAIIR